MENINYLPDINLNDFDYELPKSKIAEYPLAKRSDSKLLFTDVNLNRIEHYTFDNIVQLLPKDSHLVFNSTKVISARLLLQKPSGGKCELLLVDALKPASETALVMSSKGNCRWNCMVGGRNINEGIILHNINQEKFELQAKVIKRESNYGEVEFTWDNQYTFAELIAEIGLIPLPPYINHQADEFDKERYQTVYAKYDGSVAAPTAGLHFTDDIIQKLDSLRIRRSELALHVGPGTFLPVVNNNVSEHTMHDEMFIVNKSTILAILESMAEKKKIIAVGTTSVRTLETLYWAGVKMLKNEFNPESELMLNQDEPYRLMNYAKSISPLESYQSIIEYLAHFNRATFSGRTKLFIMPKYDYKVIDGIITNFHLPKSTLILLVAAFTGNELWRKIYNSALENNYRFLSYGDSSFLLKKS